MYLPSNENENVSKVPPRGLEQKGVCVPHHLPRGTWKAIPSQRGKAHLLELPPSQDEVSVGHSGLATP